MNNEWICGIVFVTMPFFVKGGISVKKRVMHHQLIEKFAAHLQMDEKSTATIEKYLRDIRYFAAFAADRPIDKALVVQYKSELGKTYAVTSANSMIAALNAFLRFQGWHDLCIKQFRVQKQVYCPEEKELTKAEYIRLVEAARKKGNERLSLILQTICSTGIRVSELEYITVEALQRKRAVVHCKGKTRTVFLVQALQRKLLQYAKVQGITNGAIFVTRNGKPMNRCNIWKEMKALCAQAKVSAGKVFPHNLRHLFARTFYGIEKDIAKLADILGHGSIDTTRIYIVTTGMEHRRKMEHMKLVI